MSLIPSFASETLPVYNYHHLGVLWMRRCMLSFSLGLTSFRFLCYFLPVNWTISTVIFKSNAFLLRRDRVLGSSGALKFAHQSIRSALTSGNNASELLRLHPPAEPRSGGLDSNPICRPSRRLCLLFLAVLLVVWDWKRSDSSNGKKRQMARAHMFSPYGPTSYRAQCG